jgi:Ca2+-binding RTX toxin-like protein
MAIIVGTLGDDPRIVGNDGEDNEIFGDSTGTVNVAVGSDRIFGGDGFDLIRGDALVIGPAGAGGDDVIQGGDGSDIIYGDADDLYGIGGNDTIYQNAAIGGILIGDAQVIAGAGRGGDDRLFGGGRMYGDTGKDFAGVGGDDLLDAGSSTDDTNLFGDTNETLTGNAVGGDDIVRGGAFADLIGGDADDAIDAATCGNDRVFGRGGADALSGDVLQRLEKTAAGGDDRLRGGSGDDVIRGDARILQDFATGGNDRILGDGGDDELWGDGELLDYATGGRDRFVFAGGFGDDTVQDFRKGEDKLAFQGRTQSEIQITIEGADTVLTTLGDDSVRLVGFTGPLTVGADVIFA